MREIVRDLWSIARATLQMRGRVVLLFLSMAKMKYNQVSCIIIYCRSHWLKMIHRNIANLSTVPLPITRHKHEPVQEHNSSGSRMAQPQIEKGNRKTCLKPTSTGQPPIRTSTSAIQPTQQHGATPAPEKKRVATVTCKPPVEHQEERERQCEGGPCSSEVPPSRASFLRQFQWRPHTMERRNLPIASPSPSPCPQSVSTSSTLSISSLMRLPCSLPPVGWGTLCEMINGDLFVEKNYVSYEDLKFS
jgi:hypothetical protein